MEMSDRCRGALGQPTAPGNELHCNRVSGASGKPARRGSDG